MGSGWSRSKKSWRWLRRRYGKPTRERPGSALAGPSPWQRKPRWSGFPRPGWRGDAMHQLRQIQQEESFPLPIRQAAERLSTKITQRDTAPFTSNPVADAKLIIAYLIRP